MKLWVRCRKCGGTVVVNGQRQVDAAMQAHASACGVSRIDMICGKAFDLMTDAPAVEHPDVVQARVDEAKVDSQGGVE